MPEMSLDKQLANVMFGAANNHQRIGSAKSAAFSPVFEQQRNAIEMSTKPVATPRSPIANAVAATRQAEPNAAVPKAEIPGSRRNAQAETRPETARAKPASEKPATTAVPDAKSSAKPRENDDVAPSEKADAKSSTMANAEKKADGDDSDKTENQAATSTTTAADAEQNASTTTAAATVTELPVEETSARNALAFIEAMLQQALPASEAEADAAADPLAALDGKSADTGADKASQPWHAVMHANLAAALIESSKKTGQATDELSDTTDTDAQQQALAPKLATDDAVKKLIASLEQMLDEQKVNPNGKTHMVNPHEVRELFKNALTDPEAKLGLDKLFSSKEFADAVNTQDDKPANADALTALMASLSDKLVELADKNPKFAAAMERAMPAQLAEKSSAQTSVLDDLATRINTENGLEKSTATATGLVRTGAPPTPAQLLLADSFDDQNHWGAAFAKRIQFMLNNNMQHAELRLDPPELGQVNVRIQFNSDQANIMFTSANAQVRDAIESAVPRLKELFSDSGMNLGNVDVSSFQQQQKQFDREAQQGQASRYQLDNAEATEDVLAATRPSAYTSDQLVDFYA